MLLLSSFDGLRWSLGNDCARASVAHDFLWNLMEKLMYTLDVMETTDATDAQTQFLGWTHQRTDVAWLAASVLQKEKEPRL